MLAVTRSGAGEPMVLLHALGSFRGAWEPVRPALAERYDVLAVDLPGSGDSPPLPAGVEPTPRALAEAVAAELDVIGVARPHLVGNSLGGWVALELAARVESASVTLLSPAGMWRRGTPPYCAASLRLTRWLAERHEAAVLRLARRRWGRAVVFGQTHGRPGRLDRAYVEAAVRAMGRPAGVPPALAATIDRRYEPSPRLTAPVTVAFGGRDRLLLRAAWRRVDALPPGTAVAELPGCGHVPMADDPAAVTAVILRAAERAARTARRARS
jgi:pimeloyl-ACP methyl ester carboxylesterase